MQRCREECLLGSQIEQIKGRMLLRINDRYVENILSLRALQIFLLILQISFKSVFNSGPQEKRTLIPLLVQSEGITVDIIKEYCR